MTALRQPIAGARLASLLQGFAEVDSRVDRPVSHLTLDSRCVSRGSLFLACEGTRGHGRDHAASAVAAGAVAVAVEADSSEAPSYLEGAPVIPVPALSRRAGEIAARFYGHPSRDLRVIGVTGTNGKTSVSHLVAAALSEKESRCGLIGTLGSGLFGELSGRGHTTPDAVTLQAELAAMRDAGARQVVMEVSSHGLDQHRVAGVEFDIAVFTNLSRDHLDYHGDMTAYAAAKRALFERKGLRTAVLNLDDSWGRAWWEELPDAVEAVGYTLDPDFASSDRPVLTAEGLRLGPDGLHFVLRTADGRFEVDSGMLGRFNAANLLATLGALAATGLDMAEAVNRLRGVQPPAGRMERFGGEAGQPLVVVDYAHTPDALEQVLAALREHCAARLWCVFGCGGDRDRGKRPLMGQAAEAGADIVIVTDDNPRGEDPGTITDDILAGMSAPGRARVIRDRAEAIDHAIRMAGEADVVLVAGKGHEQCQWVGGECLPFSDAEQVRRAMEATHG